MRGGCRFLSLLSRGCLSQFRAQADGDECNHRNKHKDLQPKGAFQTHRAFCVPNNERPGRSGMLANFSPLVSQTDG